MVFGVMLLIEFQRRFDIISGLFIGNASGDILTDLVVGDTYPVRLIWFFFFHDLNDSPVVQFTSLGEFSHPDCLSMRRHAFEAAYLIQNGFLNRTPRGRVATEQAYLHLGMQPEEE